MATNRKITVPRREVLKQMGGCALGAACACYLGNRAYGAPAPVATTLPVGDRSVHLADPKYLEPGKEKDEVACLVCPNHCHPAPGERSKCRTRVNHDGKLYSHAYNNPCILTLDPPEKLPIYHYIPGTKVLTVATAGCNLHCLYCQNFAQSQVAPEQLKNFYVPPEDAVKAAIDKKVSAIAYTYTDPVAFYEYSRDIAALAHEKGLKVIFGTGGYINTDPLKEWCKYADMFAITLKAFDEKFYEDVIGGELKVVQETMQTIKSEGKWLEIACLIVPGYNDDITKINAMCKWVNKNLGPDTPIHFERFAPMHKLNDLPRTPLQTLEACRKAALDAGQKYSYLCNVSPHEANNTYCPKCQIALVKRLGFSTLENLIVKGKCSKCGEQIAGLWADA